MIIYYIMLSMGTLTIGLIYSVILFLAKKKKINNFKVKTFLTESLLYIYVFIQLAFCTLNIISDGGLNSYIIAILIFCVVPIINPIKSFISIISCLAYVLLVSYLLRDTTTTWNSIVLTDTWTNVIIITVISIISACIQYYMYVANYLKSVKLLSNNEKLEDTVKKRTKELEEQTLSAITASQAKSDFLAKMSHEIRTPLNAIIGMTQIISKEKMTPKTENGISEIAFASTHLLSVLNDILDMSKIESGKFELVNEPFELKPHLNEIYHFMLVRSESKNQQFTFDADNIPNITIQGDKLRFKQVLFNILNNAVKFTQEGGKIECRHQIINETDDTITLSISVQDSGIGMTAEQITKLFKPFEQVNASIAAHYGGTGLGLAISKNFAEKMGGIISVESKEGKGSIFTIQIPFKKVIDTKNDVNIPFVIPNLSGKRILIIEDIAINRMIIEGLLQETQAFIEEAENGALGVEKFSTSNEFYYDFIFMDIQMPVMNGYEATQAIRNLNRSDAKTIPIIAMTANAYKEDIEACLQAGMNAHIAKPIIVENIMRTLINILKENQTHNGIKFQTP